MGFASLAHVTGRLQLDGQSYTFDNFQIGFKQVMDFKGQPQHETKGGQMSLTLGQAADDILYTWASNATMLKNGEIEFQTEDGRTILRILFEDAYCVRLTRKISNRNSTKTSLVIAPRYIKMQNTELHNYYPKR